MCSITYHRPLAERGAEKVAIRHSSYAYPQHLKRLTLNSSHYHFRQCTNIQRRTALKQPESKGRRGPIEPRHSPIAHALTYVHTCRTLSPIEPKGIKISATASQNGVTIRKDSVAIPADREGAQNWGFTIFTRL